MESSKQRELRQNLCSLIIECSVHSQSLYFKFIPDRGFAGWYRTVLFMFAVSGIYICFIPACKRCMIAFSIVLHSLHCLYQLVVTLSGIYRSTSLHGALHFKLWLKNDFLCNITIRSGASGLSLLLQEKNWSKHLRFSVDNLSYMLFRVLCNDGLGNPYPGRTFSIDRTA